ncbi:helix-turn-helix domain-containing protein [Maribacter ulvicola]|uniref:AraC-type DNA-binding protein n=1 Tax=Maribacter ulvicola TaxID=228959 RepID=A0A1N6YU03_9FLAO|nr:helix-turn-helix domain-containing protein [Maribacter ulvicola]SIR18128.1 AraC-type DNA-binding protein [Maribacter ulvicola]
MNKPDWNTKIQIIHKFGDSPKMLSVNSMGIYFEYHSEALLIVHFKPLNEDFKCKVFHENIGVLINFERDLIDEDDIEYALDVLSIFNKYPEFHIRKTHQTNKIQQLISLLKDEFFHEKASYIMLKTLLKLLLLHLIRFQSDELLEQDLNQKRVFQFLELMETNFIKETSTDYYAKQIGISSKRLNQILKEKLSLTAKQIIQQRQITESKRMLVKGDITTKELAYCLGFDSLSSFSRFFKKKTGISPSGFKTQN